jgi:CO/xanthine dehydrogenase Mo-binding subunit
VALLRRCPMLRPVVRGTAGHRRVVRAGPLPGPCCASAMLGGPDIEHYHQAVALVVAETFEAARSAASLVRIRHEQTLGAFDLAAARASAMKPDCGVPDIKVAQFDAAFAVAPVHRHGIQRNRRSRAGLSRNPRQVS